MAKDKFIDFDLVKYDDFDTATKIIWEKIWEDDQENQNQGKLLSEIKDKTYTFKQVKDILAKKGIRVKNNRQLLKLLQFLFAEYQVMPVIEKITHDGKVGEFRKIKII